LRLSASVQDIDYEHPRNLKPAQLARLAQGEWIERAQNLLITGPRGRVKPIWPALWGTVPACRATARATSVSPGCCWN
jgi:hypothetical protein